VVFLSYFVLKIIARRIAGKKKSYELFVLKQLCKPVLLLLFFIGLFISIETLSNLTKYDILVINGVFFIIIVLTIGLLVSRIITVIMLGYLKVRKGYKQTPGLLNKIITFIIFIVAIFIILAYFKLDITPMIAGVGLGALAIGLALQSTLSNFFAGVHLLSDQPIVVGDFIELDKDTSGFVEDIGWRSTRIRMLTDNLLIIPNAKLAESNIINYSMPQEESKIWVPCGVSFTSDLRKVEKVTLEVAKEIQETVPGAVKGFEPQFRYREFGESNINFITVLKVEKPTERFVVRNEFIKALKERYDKEKIEISWPVRKIYNAK